MYRDPWDGSLYVTAVGTKGQELISSKDNGVSWSAAPSVISSNFDKPIVITSFPKGSHPSPRLVVFTCIGGVKPSLIWSDDGGVSFSAPVSVDDPPYSLPQCGILRDESFTPSIWNVPDVSIGRAAYSDGADLVHVLYPTLTETDGAIRQDAVLANVRITRSAPNTGTVTALMIQQIVGDNNTSIYRAHLVDADRWDYSPDETDDGANIALIDWYEVSTPSRPLAQPQDAVDCAALQKNMIELRRRFNACQAGTNKFNHSDCGPLQNGLQGDLDNLHSSCPPCYWSGTVGCTQKPAPTTKPKTAQDHSKMRYRGEVIRGGISMSQIFDLSLTGGVAKYWTPVPLATGPNFYGHYDYGSFYMQNGNFNFFLHWTESNPQGSGDKGNMYLYGNLVEVNQ